MTANIPIQPIAPITPTATDAGAQNWLDLQGLQSLKSAASASPHDPATLRAVAQQFESMMINMMMKSMREAKLGDGLFDSDQTRLYQDLFDEQLSMSMSQGKGLGIADLLVRSLTPHGAAAGAALGTYHKAPKRPALAGVSSLLDVARDAGTAAASCYCAPTDSIRRGARLMWPRLIWCAARWPTRRCASSRACR